MEEKEKRMLKEYGWLVHGVFSTDGGMVNVHTHGLAENFNHPDLQVVLPANMNVIHRLLHDVVTMIQLGAVFTDGERSSDVLKNMDVYFAAYTEGGRPVLRMMLPDEKGRLPLDEGCDEMFRRQLDPLPEEGKDKDDE